MIPAIVRGTLCGYDDVCVYMWVLSAEWRGGDSSLVCFVYCCTSNMAISRRVLGVSWIGVSLHALKDVVNTRVEYCKIDHGAGIVPLREHNAIIGLSGAGGGSA